MEQNHQSPRDDTSRVICHVDFDYFFAQCEEIRQPNLKGKIVVVCVYSGRTADSGAVSTVNYLGRRYNVRSGMPIVQAKKLLEGVPDTVFLPVNHELYQSISKQVMNILQSHADAFEQTGIDEAFLDVSTRTEASFNRAIELVKTIKAEVKMKQGLQFSVGIGPSKLVAKIASDLQKPDGLTVVQPEEVQPLFARLPVGKLIGVGRKSEERLREMNVETIGDLARVDGERLVSVFGKALGTYFHLASRGVDDEPVQPREGREQLSRMVTLKENTLNAEYIRVELEKLCCEIHDRASAENIFFKSIGVMFVLEDLSIHSKTRSSEIPSNNLQLLLKTVPTLLEEFLEENTTLPIRRIGVKVSNLTPAKGQRTLSDFLATEKSS